MEKIIYFYTVQSTETKKSAKIRIAEILKRPFSVIETKGSFEGYPVEGYGIQGVTSREASDFWQKMQGNKEWDKTECRRKYNRFLKTFKIIEKQIKRKEMQQKTEKCEDAFLFFTWEMPDYPLELIKGFYHKCRKEERIGREAEQLIVLDGREETTYLMEEANKEMTFVSEVCGEYNYVTIVTERKEAWEQVTEEAYEEYGLSVRCVSDDGRLCFREKKTLILDMCNESKKCYKNFPRDSVYVDFGVTEEKRHMISVKCKEIPYLSVRNALDTVLKDTV